MQKNTANKQDILVEAESLLTAPTKDARQWLLILFNLTIGILLLVYNIFTLVKNGNFNNPARDWATYPLILIIMFSSAYYNLHHVIKKRESNKFWSTFFAWSTVLVLQLGSIIAVQANTNIALSFLSDVAISIVFIFLTTILLGRWPGLIYTIISAASMIIVAWRIGFDFHYELPGYPPKSIVIFITIWVLLFIWTFLLAFTEGGVLQKILKVIPDVVTKIRLASEEKKHLEVENMRMGAELDVARKIQMMVLPRIEELENCAGLKIAATMDPAAEVGGDYYDILKKDKITFIGIGDVTDHGLASGIVMLMVQAAFRILHQNPEPILPDAINQLNRLIFDNVQGRLRDNRNMTLSLLRHENGILKVAGQHEQIIVCRKDKKIEIFDTNDLGLYIGLIENISPMVSEIDIELHSGDLVLLYTDGATEAENISGEQFGESRLVESFGKNSDSQVKEIVSNIKSDIYNWIGENEMYDDITLVVLEKT